ncbi:hypothetical protein EX30DRAFT_166843 [Ascodesmis nigricans]|uniref:Uncharacterized protein n=1 Tax=Ascodesmis nigricans TaxID=341454 RepID=A0A4S2MM26_9PEZI|nr:hypothetical protein EX30DRAFT_166843 [Ascodesmis nigricans]
MREEARWTATVVCLCSFLPTVRVFLSFDNCCCSECAFGVGLLGVIVLALVFIYFALLNAVLSFLDVKYTLLYGQVACGSAEYTE